MTLKSRIPVLVALALALTFAVRADEVSEKGREIFKKQQKAVVTVQIVQKVTYASSGRTSEPRENKQDVTSTVIDPSGLAVLALSASDPSEMIKRMYPDYKVEVEVSDVKILLDDGTEVPAEIVLRDKDLDLAFIRPKAKLTSPMPAVDLAKSSPVQVLDSVITLNRLGRAAGRAHAASVERVTAVVQKPRTFYIPDSTMTATALGSPVFALDGNIVGVMVMRSISSGGASAGGSRQDSATSIILPAEDVLKAAKQAPEAKGDDEKKDDAKEKKETKSADTKPEPKKD